MTILRRLLQASNVALLVVKTNSKHFSLWESRKSKWQFQV